MKLKKGDKAPEFTVESLNGAKISLEDYRGKKLMIAFFRYAGCAFCHLTFTKFLQKYKSFKDRGLHVIAFIQSPPERIKSELPDILEQVDFPIIPDPKKEVYEIYGVETSVAKLLKTAKDLPGVLAEMKRYGIKQGKMDGDMTLIPAFFLIGPSGEIIEHSYYAANIADSIPMIMIEDFLTFD